jgi:uncharacterized protein
MEKIRLEIIGLSYSQSQSGAYAVILKEQNGDRRLPIIIGAFEAQAIAIEIEKIKTPRPLTHDLFRSFAKTFGIDITEVIINKVSEGVFYASLVCSDGNHSVEVDSRTSDAIALALRFQCPIFTYEQIMESAGIISDNEEEKTEQKIEDLSAVKEGEDLNIYSLEELKEMLKIAVEQEEYEKASNLRDEINKRKQQ